MTRTRFTEREIVSQLLKNLALPSPLVDSTSNLVRLGLTPDEWVAVKRTITSGAGVLVDEIGEAWRELPPHIWMDESWISRVCAKVCAFAPDYEKLIMKQCAVR